LPEESPMLRRLAAEPGVGLVAGRLLNLPVDVGQTPAYPTLGITPPPPNYLLEVAMTRSLQEFTAFDRRWQRRFGVTHGIWAADDDVRGTEVLAEVADPVLDRILRSVPSLHGRGPWKLVRNPNVFPPAWTVGRLRELSSWGELYYLLSRDDARDEAVFLRDDRPPRLPDLSKDTAGPAASVKSWDGRTAVVEREGPCILILRRTFYPGWLYRVDGGAERPVFKVNGGLQGVPLAGSGTSRVAVRYRPTGLTLAATVTLAALAAAVLVLGVAAWKAFRGPRGEKSLERPR
jgi:hypothetical protein